jgi:hypothetical protein
MPTPTDLLSSAQLRARALRLLEMADEFPDDHSLGQLLREQAGELDAQADALEQKRR